MLLKDNDLYKRTIKQRTFCFPIMSKIVYIGCKKSLSTQTINTDCFLSSRWQKIVLQSNKIGNDSSKKNKYFFLRKLYFLLSYHKHKKFSSNCNYYLIILDAVCTLKKLFHINSIWRIYKYFSDIIFLLLQFIKVGHISKNIRKIMIWY